MSEEVLEAPAASVAPVPAPTNDANAGVTSTTEHAEATSQNPAESATAKPTEPAPGEGKNRFQRRMDRAYRERAEAQAKAAFYEQQLKELQQKQSAPKTDDGAPKLEDFNDLQEYAEAYAKHKTAQTIKETEARQRQMAQVSQQQKLIESWESKASRAKYDDFDEVVGELQPSTPWAAAIMTADNGDEIAYYLGKNLEEAKAIAALDPVSQIRAIGRLEAKLAANPPAPPPKSKAPPPIAPLTGTETGTVGESAPTDNFEAWMKKRNKELGRRP